MDPSLRLGLELPPLPSPEPAAAGAVGPPTGDGGLAWPAWAALARAAQDAGFGSLWVRGGLRAAGPAAGGPEAGPVPCDACALAAALAPLVATPVLGVVAGTDRADRAPSVLARDVTALDHVSGGRAALLLEGDGPRLMEAVAVCAALFGGGPASYDGVEFHLEEAPNRPPPLRAGGPPLLASPGQVGEAVPGADALVCEDLAEERPPWIWRGAAPGPDAAAGPGDVAPIVRDLASAGALGMIVRVGERTGCPAAPGEVARLGGELVAVMEREWPR